MLYNILFLTLIIQNASFCRVSLIAYALKPDNDNMICTFD